MKKIWEKLNEPMDWADIIIWGARIVFWLPWVGLVALLTYIASHH